MTAYQKYLEDLAAQERGNPQVARPPQHDTEAYPHTRDEFRDCNHPDCLQLVRGRQNQRLENPDSPYYHGLAKAMGLYLP
jgi:hypothetical protein